ncbi:MAG: DoxX family protein [Patescibacteria group bacterium]
MLNPFPDLLVYGLLAPFILRVAVGLVFINLGYLALTKEKERWSAVFNFLRLKPAPLFVSAMGILEVAGGVLLLAGFGTQITALVLSIIVLGDLALEYKEESILSRDFGFYLLLFAITVSLLFSSAGFFAIDLPL